MGIFAVGGFIAGVFYREDFVARFCDERLSLGFCRGGFVARGGFVLVFVVVFCRGGFVVESFVVEGLSDTQLAKQCVF